MVRQEKRAQRLTCWVRRPQGGVGVFHGKGWWSKSSCPPSKVCLPWVWKRGTWDVPGILLGCPGCLGVFKKFVQRKFVCIFRSLNGTLVASYCAIPRDYLSDTPLLRATGFLVSQHGQLGAIPPPPFLCVSPLESMQSGGAIPPPQKGYLSDTCAIPYENKAIGAIPPSAILSRKGIAR